MRALALAIRTFGLAPPKSVTLRGEKLAQLRPDAVEWSGKAECLKLIGPRVKDFGERLRASDDETFSRRPTARDGCLPRLFGFVEQ